MRFQVPQFIAREMRILGPLTFKQVIISGIGVSICFVIYLSTIAKQEKPWLFFLSLIVILPITVLFTFGRIRGRSMPEVSTNFLSFMLSNRTYLWKKKAITPKIYTPPKYPGEQKAKPKEPFVPRQSASQLENLSTHLETGSSQIPE